MVVSLVARKAASHQDADGPTPSRMAFGIVVPSVENKVNERLKEWVYLKGFLRKHGFRDVHTAQKLGGCFFPKERFYPIHRAAQLGDEKALWIILRCYNVDVELETSFGRTPAMLAMEADVDGSHAGVLDLLRRPYLAWADRKVLPGIGSERTCASGRLAGRSFLVVFHVTFTSAVVGTGGPGIQERVLGHWERLQVSTLRESWKILETELKDQVTIRTKSSFKELLIEDGRVMGLNFEHENGTEQLRGTVVLTAGGYANDHADSSLLDLHTPALAKLPTTNGPFATGDVIKALVKQEAGVKTTLMDKVQIHPTGFIEVKQPNFHTKFLAPEALRGSGGILLCHGKRFANELGRRDYLTEEMFKHCKPLFDKEENPLSAAMLLTEEAVEKYGSGAMGFYKFKGLVQDVGTVEAAAEAMGTSAEVLKKTLEDYNEAAERGQDKFGKKVFPVRFPSTAHLYVAFVTPTLHYCMGGLAINVRTEVLHSDGQPIPNLYGAGEVTGGVHGNNRLGGNSLLECAVFGRMAGAQAAEKAKDGRCDTERGSAGGA
ncbi:Fumarate reductase (FRDS) (FAD-dependent oxidoreductase) (NADH-dependent fumarate reductase) [Durusdinium trenchii]|uniref:Fumarate reductase (FRDS) (FAD-dependent oxidoreductase) (NADH-dependent fumarate reductase) n=1 Tax=Durusdinium trenchii TaxID=1381693 RepID=A0ABP0L5C8_9DINO